MILLTFFLLQEGTVLVFVFDFHKLLKRTVNGSKIDTLYEINQAKQSENTYVQLVLSNLFFPY